MDAGCAHVDKLDGVHRSPLTPVFAGLQLGLHALTAALTAVVILRAVLLDAPNAPAIVVLSVAFLAVYAAGATRRLRGGWWLAALTALWVALMVLAPDAAISRSDCSSCICICCRDDGESWRSQPRPSWRWQAPECTAAGASRVSSVR